MSESMESWSESRLFEEAMRGGVNANPAFALFCKKALPRLRTHVEFESRRYGVGPDQVEDLCNVTIVRVLDYIKERPLPAETPNPIRQVTAWLNTIASNVVRDHVGKASHRHEVSGTPLERSAPLRPEEVVELEDLFATLPPREQEVMVAIYLEKLTVADTAEKLGTTVDAVRKAHHRALAKLREQMRGDGW